MSIKILLGIGIGLAIAYPKETFELLTVIGDGLGESYKKAEKKYASATYIPSTDAQIKEHVGLVRKSAIKMMEGGKKFWKWFY